MKIVCVTNSFENKSLYKLAKIILGDKIKRDITVRNPEILAEINGTEISIKFMTFKQHEMQFQGLRPDILIFQGDIPEHLKMFVSSVKLTGGLLMEL